MAGKLAIVGGGPKAAAIAAKASSLSRCGYSPPEIYIFEHDSLAAAWSGKSGYTDGLQPLCTLAERDLGYPYDRNSFGTDVAHATFADFSWHAYAVRDGTDRTEYDQWVLRGRNPPSHCDFGSYVSMAIKRSGATHVIGKVVDIRYVESNGIWRVTWEDRLSNRLSDEFAGVVITGSGNPLPILPGANERVFNGKSFWQQIPSVLHLLENDADPSVMIIGAGGTAAAIALWFIRQHIDTIPITIVGREPTLYTRLPGYFEDRLFTDLSAWDLLPDEVKDIFVGRLTRGVVWDSVMRGLTTDNVSYECYDVRRFVGLAGRPLHGLPVELAAEFFDVVDPTGTAPATAVRRTQSATVFIDARGFDPWWFVGDLMRGSLTQMAFFAQRKRTEIMANVDSFLGIGGTSYPHLHVPRLGSRRGPAASNLMALGWVADQVLSEYITKAAVYVHLAVSGQTPP